MHNHGIGGDDTVGVLRRLDLVTRAQPAKVFLMIGTNDLGKGTLTIDEIVANVEEIVTRIRIENPTSEVYVQSVLPRWHTRTEDLRRLNDGLESVACERRTWIDLRPLFDQGDGTMDLDLAPDALTPTPRATDAGSRPSRRWSNHAVSAECRLRRLRRRAGTRTSRRRHRRRPRTSR